MKLGDKRQAILEGDITRTGTVVYIHPLRIFYILEFECAGGKYRESFLTGRERSGDKRKREGR